MNNDRPEIKTTLDRLSKIVRRQYGCEFEFLDHTQLQTQALNEIYELLAKGKPAMNEAALFFPVIPNGRLVGAAQIEGHQKLAQSEIANLNQTIRMVLEAYWLNEDRLETLNTIEAQLNRILTKDSAFSNIVDFRDLKSARETDVDSNRAVRQPLLERLNFPFLIEAQTEEDAFRMAFEIHDLSGRNLFVPLEDLEATTFATIESLASLGACTIYATDFEVITPELQKFLVTYYQSPRSRRTPQIVLGTTRSLTELKLDPMINKEFLSQLTTGYLYLSQPFSFYKSGDLLEFFFDSLTGRSKTQ